MTVTVCMQVHLVGLDIFTGKKFEELCQATHNMDVPAVRRTEYDVHFFTCSNSPLYFFYLYSVFTSDCLQSCTGTHLYCILLSEWLLYLYSYPKLVLLWLHPFQSPPSAPLSDFLLNGFLFWIILISLTRSLVNELCEIIPGFSKATNFLI